MSRGLVITAGLAIAFLAGCSDPKGAERVLAAQGFTRIDAGGFDLFSSCPDDSYKSTAFRAVGVNGVPVTGRVCSELFRGSTVRIN
jgi:hypothetical protein